MRYSVAGSDAGDYEEPWNYIKDYTTLVTNIDLEVTIKSTTISHTCTELLDVVSSL
jgi:hypothetical protein